jgi:signal transduction histidine kinase/sensor domain CHASE-containing protein
MFKANQRRTYKYLPVGLCLVCGTILAIAISVFAKKWEDTNNQAQFQQRISNLTTALNRTVNRYTEVLYSLRDLYSTSPIPVQRSQFNAFTERAVSSYRGIQALEWAKRVSSSEKIAFERSIQKSGYPKFQIYEKDRNDKPIPVKKRSQYIPVLYIHPWEQNEVALGFDLASNQERRIALEKARDSGDITATGRIRLVQEQKDQYGFLVFLPIYNNKYNKNRQTPNKLKTRAEVEGYILGVFRVTDVIEESLQGINTDIDFEISYEKSEQGFLGFYKSKTKSFLSKLPSQNRQIDSLCSDYNSCSRKISVGDRIWLIQFQPTESYSDRNRSWLPEAILLIGLILTGALSFYLRGAIAELERTKELSELKLRLFSMASHEFRTPLSTILISAQSLETHDLENGLEQSQKISRRIQSAAKRMNQLLADILTLSRAEAGKLEFDPEIINLKQFCHQLIEEIENSLEVPRQITFIVVDDLNPVFLDKKLLRSIVTNLLSNAIKYSSIDTIVEFQLSGDRHFITLTISDRGIGIPPHEHEKIFDGYYRAQNIGDIEGSGLGMTVIKTCTDLHGGKISLNSKLGEGTTFTVILPLKN